VETGVFSDRNLSKSPLDRRFTVFSPKKRLHISSVQDTMAVDVRAVFIGNSKLIDSLCHSRESGNPNYRYGFGFLFSQE
jgi:hypothetical protein